MYDADCGAAVAEEVGGGDEVEWCWTDGGSVGGKVAGGVVYGGSSVLGMGFLTAVLGRFAVATWTLPLVVTSGGRGVWLGSSWLWADCFVFVLELFDDDLFYVSDY